MQRFALPFALLLAVPLAAADTPIPAWQPSPGHTQIALWPGTPPNPRPNTPPEKTEISAPNDLVAGKQVIAISNVTVPTMTVYSPTGHNTGAAVVVFPGGGYNILAIDLKAPRSATGLLPKASLACC